MSPRAGPLSETEQLIIAYLSKNPPEEGMLDKIAMGTGRSRATVLKYLGSLYAKGILGYRVIGRNKLWMVKESPALPDREAGTGPADGTEALAARAFAMHAAILRQAELETLLDTPETFVLTMLDDSSVVFRNRLAASLFSGTPAFFGLLRPEQAARLRERLAGRDGRSPISLELDLREQTGVLRRYLVTFAFPHGGEPSGCIAVIGEDLASRRHSKRDLASLLAIVRAAGMTRTEDELLRVAMKGIRDSLVPALFGAVFLEDTRVAFATREIPAPVLAQLQPLIDRCRDTLATVAAGREDPDFPALQALAGNTPLAGAVVVPIIDQEEAAGAILLLLEEEVAATDLGNVEIVADEIAGMLRMQRLDRERSEYTSTLLALNRLSGVLNETRDEGMLLGRAIDTVMDALGFEMGCVYIKDVDDGMVPRVQKNMPAGLRKICMSGVFDTLFDRAFAEKSVLYITPDLPEYAGLDPEVKRSGVRTILIVPIRIGDRVEGLLNMGSRQERQYLPTSLTNIASLGLQLGTALERSRLAQALADAPARKRGG